MSRSIKLTAWATTALVVLLSLSTWAASPEEGRTLYDKYKCGKCHEITPELTPPDSVSVTDELEEGWGEESKFAGGKPSKPPNLADVGSNRDSEWIIGFLSKQIDIDGRKHKIRFKGSEEELTILAEWLAGLKGLVPDSTDQQKDQSERTE